MSIKDIVMIRQPMQGLTDREIRDVREEAEKYLEEKGYEILNTYMPDVYDNIDNPSIYRKSLYMLSKTIEAMSKCDSVYFCRGWENYRGCVIENEIAKKYGLEVLYQK